MKRPLLWACVALALLGTSLTSCDDTIYDEEGDCSKHYRVSFRYDYNMKFADAFPHEVNAVTLYLADNDGNIVWQGSGNGEPLVREGYEMDVDVAPGHYSLLAWASGNGNSFDIGNLQSASGNVRREDLTAKLQRERDDSGTASSDKVLSRLFHGYVGDVEFPDTEGTHHVTVPLVKDTNYLKVVLQQTSGAPMETKDLDISIVDDNGLIEWNNDLRTDEAITYRPSSVTPIAASISPDDESGTQSQVKAGAEYTGLMAEFHTSRLVESHRDKARLTVRNRATGNTIFSVKLIDFLLMVKGEYNRAMTDQEYLDRQDVYDLVFFLDENHKWGSATIFINSWRVVLQNVDIK